MTWMMNMYEYKLDYLNWISWNNRNICINEHDTTIFLFVSTNGEKILKKTTKCNRFVIIIYLDKFQFFKNFQYNVYVKYHGKSPYVIYLVYSVVEKFSRFVSFPRHVDSLQTSLA